MKSGAFDLTKSSGTTPNDPMADKKAKRHSHVLVGIAASVLTLGVALAVVVSLYFGTHLCHKAAQTEKFVVQISDSPSTADVSVIKARRLIFTETQPSGTLDHTITLQDYNRDLQAIKDLSRNRCYILPVFNKFEDAIETAEANSTSTVEPKPSVTVKRSATTEAIPGEILPWAVGDYIADLCADVPTYWLYDTEDTTRAKRGLRITIHVDIVFIEVTVTIDL